MGKLYATLSFDKLGDVPVVPLVRQNMYHNYCVIRTGGWWSWFASDWTKYEGQRFVSRKDIRMTWDMNSVLFIHNCSL